MDNAEGKFEVSMKRLEEIVKALEEPDLPLEEGMRLYREGAACSRFCRQRLEQARHELEVWQADGTSSQAQLDDFVSPSDESGLEE